MKIFRLVIISLLLAILNSCFSSPPARPYVPEPPRREFQEIEPGVFPSHEPSIIGDFAADNNSFSMGSIYFSTALFLSDLGILADVPGDIFDKYAAALFTNFPCDGEVKQIVIPGLSVSQKEDDEKDAYFFITKETRDGKEFYLVESNIPIASITDLSRRTYNGYVMRSDAGFYRNRIPARWTSIMNIMTSENALLYRGVAYPSKSAPLIFTGTGFGSDVRMDVIISEQLSISEIADNLKNAFEDAVSKAPIANQEQMESMRFLEKFTYLSLAVYSYIDSDILESERNFLLARQIEVKIPDDLMGNRYHELEKIMDHLLNRGFILAASLQGQ